MAPRVDGQILPEMDGRLHVISSEGMARLVVPDSGSLPSCVFAVLPAKLNPACWTLPGTLEVEYLGGAPLRPAWVQSWARAPVMLLAVEDEHGARTKEDTQRGAGFPAAEGLRRHHRLDQRGMRDEHSLGQPAEGSFDLLYSRFGVMFFSDPVGAFRHLRGAGYPDPRARRDLDRGPSARTRARPERRSRR
jgi:hypothetical protein